MIFSGTMGRVTAVAALVFVAFLFFQSSSVFFAQTPDAQVTYDRAVQLIQSGKNAEAMVLIDAALKAGRSDPSLYNLKGLAASELGRDAEAENSFRNVIRLSPKLPMGYNNLGILLSKLGRFHDAATNFREAHARDPRNFTALLGLGTSLAALRQYDDASQYLKQAWDVRPGDFQAGYEWAHARFEGKHSVEAKKILNQVSVPPEPNLAVKYYSLAGAIAAALKDDVAAAQAYRQAFALNSASYEIYLALAQASLSSGPVESGARQPEAQSKRETLPTPPENLTENQNLALGLLFLSHEQYSEAIPLLEQALQQDESDEPATLNLALAYKNIGKLAAAIELTRHALKRKPSGALYNMLAGIEEASGQYVDAVQHYQRAVELEPTNEDYYFDLGMEYLSHFTFGPALEVYRVGTQKFPNSSRQYLGLGFSHYAVREYPEAASALTKALEIDPEAPAVLKAWNTVLNFLSPTDWQRILPRLSVLAAGHPRSADLSFCYGAALFRSEFAKGTSADLDRPELFLEKAINLHPDFPSARLELAALYAAEKQDQKAVDQYLEAIREDPKSDIPYYRLGQLYRKMNKMDLATAELTRYQELSLLHQEEIKRNRSLIQQFVLPQAAKSDN